MADKRKIGDDELSNVSGGNAFDIAPNVDDPIAHQGGAPNDSPLKPPQPIGGPGTGLNDNESTDVDDDTETNTFGR